MSSDKEKLDDAKRRYLEAKQEIERLRIAIASATCPLKIGETITVLADGNEYQGTIEHIHYANGREEMLDPVVGTETGWAASGSRLGKNSGNPCTGLSVSTASTRSWLEASGLSPEEAGKISSISHRGSREATATIMYPPRVLS